MRDGVVTWGDRAGLVAVGVSIAACGGHVTAVLRRPKGPPRVYDRSLAVSGPPGARTRSVLAKDDSAEGRRDASKERTSCHELIEAGPGCDLC